MSDLQVIYDPSLEIGAIIDLDTNMGWGPICPGPRGGELLQAYVDGMPFDLAILTEEQARDIFLSVFRDDAAAAITDATPAADNPVVADNDPVAAAAASGSAEPVEDAGTVPVAQSADADMAADTSQTDTVTTDPTQPVTPTVGQTASPNPTVTTPAEGNCLLCNANGQGSTNPGCLVCHGTGKVQAQP